MTPEQGLIDLETTYKRELAMGWAFIRKLALFVGEWGPAYIFQVADHLGRAPKTLQNYISIARSPISHYAESLGLSRADASAVVGLPEEEAKALLLQAAEQGLSDDWLRAQARAKKNSVPPTGSSTGSLTGKEGNGEVATYSYTEEFDDDAVPFALPPDPVEGEANDTPFDVAERIVVRFGVDYARQVAEEITRWGEWQ